MPARTAISFARQPSSRGSHASLLSPAPLRRSRPSRVLEARTRCLFRSGLRRELLDVVRVEEIGPYRLLRLKRGRLESGVPGQFFMLAPPGRLLPRPMSLCLATRTELGFLIDPVGPGTKALTGVVRGERLHVLGPLGNG